MYDTLSFLVPGLIIVFGILIIGILIYLLLKRKIPRNLSLFISALIIGYIFSYLHAPLFRDIFYLVAIICLVLFIIDLFRKKKNKAGGRK